MQNITNETITRNTTSSRIASTSPSPRVCVCVFIHWYARTDEITAMPSKPFPSYVFIQLLGKEEETLNIQRYCETQYQLQGKLLNTSKFSIYKAKASSALSNVI